MTFGQVLYIGAIGLIWAAVKIIKMYRSKRIVRLKSDKSSPMKFAAKLNMIALSGIVLWLMLTPWVKLWHEHLFGMAAGVTLVAYAGLGLFIAKLWRAWMIFAIGGALAAAGFFVGGIAQDSTMLFALTCLNYLPTIYWLLAHEAGTPAWRIDMKITYLLFAGGHLYIYWPALPAVWRCIVFLAQHPLIGALMISAGFGLLWMVSETYGRWHATRPSPQQVALAAYRPPVIRPHSPTRSSRRPSSQFNSRKER